IVDLNWGGELSADAAARHVKGRKARRAARAAEDSQNESLPGLADLLRREVSLRDTILETEDPHLTIVTAGIATPAEGQVFARSERLSQVLETLERHNDRLILDLPPVLASSAAIPLARQAGGVAMVVREGVTTESQVRSACDRLGPIPCLGVV